MFASVATILGVSAAQAATVTWNNSGGGSTFNTDGNWVGGTAPVSGVDTVALVGSAGTAFMNSNFTVASGQSFSDNNSGLPLRLQAGGHLTVESGGTLNLPGGLAESGTGALTVKFEYGSSATIGNLFTGSSSNWAWEFVSNDAEVSVLNATGGFLNIEK